MLFVMGESESSYIWRQDQKSLKSTRHKIIIEHRSSLGQNVKISDFMNIMC